MNTQQIQDIVRKLEAACRTYYQHTGELVLTDAAYDALEDQLRALDPTHAHFQTVGAAPLPGGGWPKVRHSIPMGSLNKAQTPDDLKSWWPNKGLVCITHKLDGISCFDGDTPIHLANGETLPIREVVEQGLHPQVLTWSPEEGVTTRQVTNTFDNGDRDNWVRLTLEDGSSIVVTEDHKFYVPGEGWVPARDLLGKDLRGSSWGTLMRVTNIERVFGPRRAYDLEVEDTHAYFVGPGVLAHNCSLRYKDGRLVQALTRGDGDVGEDITRNVLLMQGAVRQIPTKGAVYVRGEIVCRKSDFAAHFQGESNPRNTAAGTAKRQSDNDKCRHLTVVAYQYLPDGTSLATKVGEINALSQAGFVVPPYYEAATPAEIQGIYDTYVATKRDALDWEIDGLVIDVNDRDTREALGDLNSRPRGAVAYKFPHDQKATYLRAVRWQVGKSGRLTPVADFDTVKLAGADVSKASLHNTDIIEALCSDAKVPCLHAGDQILVARRNDVIPYVEAILVSDHAGQGLFTPTHCPDCNTAVVRDGAYLRCPNGDSCPAQIAGAVKRWISKIGVLHFGDALIDMLCESGKVEQIADIYALDPKDVAMMGMGGRMVGGTATKAFNNLHANKTIPLHVFVGSLGINLIGRSMAKTIADAGFDSLNKMSKARIADIAAIPGVGQAKAEAFTEGFWDLLDRGVITALLRHITIANKAVGAMTGKSVCMTGFRDKQMDCQVEALGGTIKSSVGKGLTYLVCKDPSSTSGKAQQARALGVTIVSIDEMWDLLGGKP